MKAPVDNPPQFLLLTFDDAIQDATWGPSTGLLAGRKNPNGCPATATFFTQVFYSDPYLATQWYAQNNEIADHTVTHNSPFAGTYAEIEGQRAWAASLAGIPRGKIMGFRHPYLNYTVESLNLLAKMGFTYESSMSSTPNDRVWPYTLDNGAVNDCMNIVNVCGKELNAPGLWEIPMATITSAQYGLELMDPFNIPTQDKPQNGSLVTADYRTAFDSHYGGNRAPFGVYVHPIWLGKPNPPSISDGAPKFAAVSAFLDYALSRPDVWMVTNAQVIEYMKNPVPASQLGSQPYMQCQRNPAPPTGICNGLNGTAPEACNLANGTIHTCYGCPSDYPTLENPAPKATGSRCAVPDNCDTLYWDPVGCKCGCPSGAACSWSDTSRPINLDPSSLNKNNGSNGGNGASGTNSASETQGMGLLGLMAAAVAGAVFVN
ncbi:hypothetical protein HK104_010601 [Borealophlyctis nickersoniae]|nr:hypothetical protein HK104_010601 [Borealophlyctis nickersoniae]